VPKTCPIVHNETRAAMILAALECEKL